jgi:hypothetical protein
MKSPKVIIIVSAAGFFLSFITALISGAGFGAVLLKAFVSAAVCAAVVAGLSFAARKFLLENTQDAAADEARENGETGGSIVNIVLEDEGLPSEPDAPLFKVDGITQPLAGQSKQASIMPSAEARLAEIGGHSPENVRTEAVQNKDAGAQANGAGFTLADITSVAASASMRDFSKSEKAEFSAGKMPEPQALAHTAEPAAKSAPAKSGTLGAGLMDLPDIGMLVTEGLSTDDDVVRDTEFAAATKDEVAARHKIRAAENIDISDSKAVASAIRTLLVNE